MSNICLHTFNLFIIYRSSDHPRKHETSNASIWPAVTPQGTRSVFCAVFRCCHPQHQHIILFGCPASEVACFTGSLYCLTASAISSNSITAPCLDNNLYGWPPPPQTTHTECSSSWFICDFSKMKNPYYKMLLISFFNMNDTAVISWVICSFVNRCLTKPLTNESVPQPSNGEAKLCLIIHNLEVNSVNRSSGDINQWRDISKFSSNCKRIAFPLRRFNCLINVLF